MFHRALRVVSWLSCLVALGGCGATVLDEAEDGPTDSDVDSGGEASLVDSGAEAAIEAATDAPDDSADSDEDTAVGDGDGPRCGDIWCTAGEYCREVSGGPPPGIDRATCEPLPPGCGSSPTCDCLQDNWCPCSEVPGGLYVTCLVP